MTMTLRSVALCSLFVALSASPAAAQTATPPPPECSAVIKNPACTVTINRESPSTPQPFLMTGHATIIISIRKRPFDKIDVNSTFTDVVPVNPLAAIIGAFAPSFTSITVSEKATPEIPHTWMLSTENAKPIKATTPDAKLLRDLGWIATQQDVAKKALQGAKDKLKPTSDEVVTFNGRKADTWTPGDLEASAKALLTTLDDADNLIVPSGVVAAIDDAVTSARKAFAQLGNSSSTIPQEAVAAIGAALNGVDAQQTQLNASAKSILASQEGLRAARLRLKALTAPDTSLADALLFTDKIETSAYGPARSVKSTVTVTDLLSKDKTDLGTISASWNSTRWEVSTGTVFSTRPIRSYSVASSVVVESNTRPMVVPFALAHFNLWEMTAGQHRVALLASGGIGINPNSKSADFGYGASIGYRGVYLSALNHKSREVTLSGGVKPGQTVDSSVTKPATELVWQSRFRLGIALTLRVPF